MKLLSLLLLAGCVDGNDDYKDADRTPAGYHVVYHDAGLLSSGLMTYEQILGAFDAAYMRAALDLETRYGLDRQRVLSMPWEAEVVFKLVDHYRFEVGGIYAVGLYETDPCVSVAMHPKRFVEPGVPLPADALPWTLVIGPTTGRSYYGILDVTNAFPALAHEVGHHFYGPGFEH